jgi:hypothetical protein
MPEKEQSILRSYKAPWRGELLLACTKCQRKLKKHKGTKTFANVKKWFKRRGKKDDGAPEVRVVGIDCIKLCPKAGVTIARQHQLGDLGGEVSILRSEADLEDVYTLISASQSARKVSDIA